MSILLIYRVNMSDPNLLGIHKKMKDQIQGWKDLGRRVDAVYIKSDGIYINDTLLVNSTGVDQLWFRHRRFFQLLSQNVELRNYDLIYLRYPFSSSSLLNFCRKAKKENSQTKLILELPTYPYGHEFNGFRKLLLLVDRFYRKHLKNYVDYIVHLGPDKSIWGIPCINLTNGIDFTNRPLSRERESDGDIYMLAVGNWQRWHGLDRLLMGMNDFRKRGEKLKMRLKIVGEGADINFLKEFTKSLNLEDHVEFAGILKGQKLNDAFDQSDIAIGTLGMHRKNLHYNASLKHREYVAYGMPFILSTADAGFPKECGFVYYFAEDDSPIEMQRIKDFVETVPKKIEIRKYGERNLSWKTILRKLEKASLGKA